MASNPFVNHVELADGTMLMDIRDTTADAESVENGRVFYSASGARTIGAMPVKLDQAAAYVEYSDSGTYSVGDIRTHGGRIYRCNTAIAEAEEWDSTHWTEVTIGELLFGKADKAGGATQGDVAILDASGNLVDSGKTLGVSVPANAVFTDTTYTFTDNNPTLAWGTQSKVATVGGVDIHVTMPANPNTDHYDWSDITNKPASYPGGCTGNAASATASNYPLGFTSRSTNATWGNQTGTTITSWGESNGGSIDFRRDNPSSGKMSIKVDGRFYGNEGSLPAMLMNNNNGYWGMGDPDGNYGAVWIRTTENGIIPNQSGNASNGHCYLGTDTWYFRYGYIQDIYGYLHGNISGSAGSVAWANVTGKPSAYPPESHTHSYLPLAGGNMTGKIYSGATRMLQWTTSDSDNNPDGASWYGLGKFTPSGDYAWICLSNYWGISIRARDSAHVKINGNVVINAGNYTSYVPQVWSGKVNFSNGVSDLASTIGSGKTIYAAFYNGDAVLNGFVMGCSGTKVYLVQIIPGTGGRYVPSGSTNQPITIIYK